MINRKIFLCFIILFVFVVSFIYAEHNSVSLVSVLNGSSTKVDQNLSSSFFVGQAIVFETKGTKDLIATSGFASTILKVNSHNITFINQTEDKVFENIKIPVKIEIKTAIGKITKVRYKISQGGEENWEDEIDCYEGSEMTGSSTFEFSKDILFTKGKSENYIKVYAQYTDGTEYGSSWSPAYTIKINNSDEIEFISPDRLTKLSSLNPKIQTNEFSLTLSTVTVSFFEGNFDISGTKLYEIYLDTETNKTYKMYNESLGKISYFNSEVIKKYNEKEGTTIPETLKDNQEYTLKIESNKGTDTVTFKAIGGGVADILPYPSPFNPNKEKVKIRYLIAEDSRVTIKLYDKAGKIVCKLIQSEHRNAGTNEEEWDGKNYAGEKLATGAYIVEIVAKSSSGEDRRYTALAIVGK